LQKLQRAHFQTPTYDSDAASFHRVQLEPRQ
jgi:hypothetical protein